MAMLRIHFFDSLHGARGASEIQVPPNIDDNRRMSKVRECVEWGFGKIVNLWAFLDLKKNLQIFSSPVSTYYTDMANLTNCHTCFYGGQTASHFKCMPPSLEEYLL